MATETADPRTGLAGTNGVAGATQVKGRSVKHPIGTGDSRSCRTVTDAGAVPGTRLEHGRYASAFSIDLARGWAPGVVAGRIGIGPGGSKR